MSDLEKLITAKETYDSTPTNLDLEDALESVLGTLELVARAQVAAALIQANPSFVEAPKLLANTVNKITLALAFNQGEQTEQTNNVDP